MSRSLAENITLGGHGPVSTLGFIHRRLEQARTRAWLDRLSTKRRSVHQSVRELSGGNQQKIAMARMLYRDVDVLLLDEPTRGIDVGSKTQIYRQIGELAAAGKAIIFASSYVPELLGVCDHIAVMRRGRIGPARPASQCTEHAIIMEATGAAA